MKIALSFSNSTLRCKGLASIALPILVACGGGGGGGGDAAPTPVLTVASLSATSAVWGQAVVLTVSGSNLDQALNVSSPGCTGITRSTAAPRISTATTAYYTCTASAYGAQQFSLARGADGVSLGSAPYTVTGPVVAAAQAGTASLGQTVVFSLQGSNLDLPLSVTATGCTGMARSTAAPLVSSSTMAYYTCTASAVGAQTLSVARSADGQVLGTASFTVPAAAVPAVPAAPVVNTASASGPRYSQQLVLTLNGSHLDLPLTVTSSGCTNIARSTTAPFVSSAATAYYTCKVNGVGTQNFALARGSDALPLGNVSYTVPVPQVTMTVSNGLGVDGSYVVTLAPQQAPVTVDNFLSYVNSGYYNNTIFHRSVSNFVVQAGGYAASVSASAQPALKPTNPNIVLEDNVGLSNTRMTIAMARLSAPDTASAQFFINLADNLGLNRTATARGYAVFGSITSGASVVDSIAAAPCTSSQVSECLPIPNVIITSAVQTQ